MGEAISTFNIQQLSRLPCFIITIITIIAIITIITIIMCSTQSGFADVT